MTAAICIIVHRGSQVQKQEEGLFAESALWTAVMRLVTFFSTGEIPLFLAIATEHQSITLVLRFMPCKTKTIMAEAFHKILTLYVVIKTMTF